MREQRGKLFMPHHNPRVVVTSTGKGVNELSHAGEVGRAGDGKDAAF